MEVEVYRSRKRVETYLLVRAEDGLGRVPKELFQHFGEALFSFRFTLDGERRLSRIDPLELRDRLLATGYWLQLPPPMEVPV
jgi:uncharacterized protein YcgL (UPF0745 family)